MGRLPTTTVVRVREARVASVAELADRLGVPVWVPPGWPQPRKSPDVLVMLSPSGNEGRTGYQLRTRGRGPLLIVYGFRRQEGGNLEDGLRLLDGERFETWSRPPEQPSHIVVRAPIFDVHVSGSVPYDTALAVAQSLIEVAPAA